MEKFPQKEMDVKTLTVIQQEKSTKQPFLDALSYTRYKLEKLTVVSYTSDSIVVAHEIMKRSNGTLKTLRCERYEGYDGPTEFDIGFLSNLQTLEVLTFFWEDDDPFDDVRHTLSKVPEGTQMREFNIDLSFHYGWQVLMSRRSAWESLDAMFSVSRFPQLRKVSLPFKPCIFTASVVEIYLRKVLSL
ncbi:hypothetical protein BDQ17DRAFT_746814 [Cyathus striatus]|nr:hypothetical protein BDQ17DRAFT_746814 [Cyathus striatus]